MDAAGIAAAAAIAAPVVWKLTTLVKALTAGAYRQALTQVVVYVIGIAVTALFAASDFAGALAGLNGASVVIVGIEAASIAMVSYEVKKAVDNNESAVEPKLGG